MSPTLLPDAQPTVAQAADLLRAGRVAIAPTETVYALALNLHSGEARRRVKALKQLSDRPDGSLRPAWVLHCGVAEQALAHLPGLAPLGRRMIRKAWPGPVALQFRLSSGDAAGLRGWLGDAAGEALVRETRADGVLVTFRCPEVPLTQEILAACDFPVAMLAAAPGVHEIADLPPALAGQVDVIIDGGPTRYRKPSTLVRVEGGEYRVLRPGVIDERIIHRVADYTLLFVCTGNTCRSPMAAGLAAQALGRRLGVPPAKLREKHVVVQSAGLHAMAGMPASAAAVTAAAGHGVALGGHQSQPVTPDLLRRADVVYTMTRAQREEIVNGYPAAANKTFRLDPDADIDDPIGADEDVYRQVAQHLESILTERLSEIPV